MVLGVLDPGWLGSPVDVATFVVVVALLGFRLRPRVETLAAAVVALARRTDHVDDERLVDELDVEESEVDALEPTIIHVDEDERGS